MNKRLIVLILVLNFIFATGLLAEEGKERYKLTGDIIKKLDIKVYTVKKKDISISKKYPAVVKENLNSIEMVYSQIDGLVKKLFVKEGDYVKKGEVLAYIYSPEIARIQSELYIARVKLKTALENYKRAEYLYKNEVIPYSKFFEAKIQYENAKGEVKALKKSLSAYGNVKNGLVVIKSLKGGVIVKQNVVLGDSVNLDKPMFEIHSHEKLWVVGYIPVKDLTLFKKNQKVKIVSPLGSLIGKVEFISPEVDLKTKRAEIRIVVFNKNSILKPNMFVDIFLTKKLKEGIYIPASSVITNENKRFVFKLNVDYVIPQEVHIDKRFGSYYKVLSGINYGDRIITKGSIYLKAKFFGEAEE